jgi:hypothetical protein
MHGCRPSVRVDEACMLGGGVAAAAGPAFRVRFDAARSCMAYSACRACQPVCGVCVADARLRLYFWMCRCCADLLLSIYPVTAGASGPCGRDPMHGPNVSNGTNPYPTGLADVTLGAAAAGTARAAGSSQTTRVRSNRGST